MCARCDCECCRDPAAPHQALIPSLVPYTKYEVLVNPFNKVGPGPASAKAIVSTLEGGEHSDIRVVSLYKYYLYHIIALGVGGQRWLGQT